MCCIFQKYFRNCSIQTVFFLSIVKLSSNQPWKIGEYSKCLTRLYKHSFIWRLIDSVKRFLKWRKLFAFSIGLRLALADDFSADCLVQLNRNDWFWPLCITILWWKGYIFGRILAFFDLKCDCLLLCCLQYYLLVLFFNLRWSFKLG